MLSNTESVCNYDWEWILIQINGINGSLGDADYFTAADCQVVVTAVNATDDGPPGVKMDKPLSKFTSIVEWDSDHPEWFETGMVAYKAGTVTDLEVVLLDKDQGPGNSDDVLMKTKIAIPSVKDKWVQVSPSATSGGDDDSNKNTITLHLSLRKSSTPLFTSKEQNDMPLTEVLFDLKDGSKASLVHAPLTTKNNNTKAILYFPGRTDSFAHPHVLQMYQSKGYDFYSLDPRACGRSRRFMNTSDIFQAHSISNFDIYKEEIDLAMEFIRNQTANYTQILSHSHSTGALVTLNYAMMTDDEPFDGYVLNGPFLDWAYVGGDLNELVLEYASGAMDWLGIAAVRTANTLNTFHTKNWIINRWNTTQRPIWGVDVTTEWAKAVSDVQHKIVTTPLHSPITSKPVLLIASQGDVTLMTSESEERMPHIATNYSQDILKHNSHDVTHSDTPALNADAIASISKWLDDPTPTHFGPGDYEGDGTVADYLNSIYCWFSSLIGSTDQEGCDE